MLADGELIGVLSDILGAQYVTIAEDDQEPYVTLLHGSAVWTR
jgi:hypothetical protein